MSVSVESARSEDLGDPRTEYKRRLEAERALAERAEQVEAITGNGRFAVGVLAVGVLFLVFALRLLHPAWLALPAAAFVGLSAWHQRARRGLRHSAGAVGYYERALARLDGRWAGGGDPGARYGAEDHPNAADLDLFGEGSLFQLLCTARTRKGADRLASWLLAPAPPDEVRARQAAVAELRDRLDLRLDLALLGSDVPAGIDLEGLARWGEAPALLVSRGARVAAGALALLGVVTLVGYLAEFGPLPLGVVLLLEGALALALGDRVRRVVKPLEQRARDLAVFSGLLARLEREPFAAPLLVRLRAALDATGRRPSAQIDRLTALIDKLEAKRNLYFAPFAALLMWTTHIAFALESWRAGAGRAIRGWLDAVAEFEALCAMATYAYENPADPFPEIVAEGPLYDGEGLGHPLLPPGECVRNDVRLGDDLRVLVVSGSNMSGKSTLLRTVGINAVLAQAGAPVRATRLRLSPLTVGATLRIQDSLQAGRSRFYAEVLRVRQLLELARGPRPLLFLLDEIFHGTNSHDRRLGAEAVVRTFVAAGAVGLLTTHDLALAHIAEALAPRAANVHFEDRFEDGRPQFDYRMRPGVVRHSNALALMRSVGIEVEADG